MARDEDDDLYDEEFDFVDDDDDLDAGETDEELTDEASDVEDRADDEHDERPQRSDREERHGRDDREVAQHDGGEQEGESDGEEPVDEYGRPETTPANYVVHIYEHKKFKRTIERPFTPEDAESFATEFNRTSKAYGRVALTSKNDAKPKKALD